MASSDGRCEIPDSEDEPMTSSPVDFMDGAADKLSAPARVPLQDAQDAPTEPARAHQAIAEDVANVPGTRTDGLDVDQHNASSDVNARIDRGADTQPHAMTSEEAHLIETNDATHALNLQQTLPPQPDAGELALQQSAVPPTMISTIQQEPETEAEHTSDSTTTNQDHPGDARNIDRNEQLAATNDEKSPPTPNAIHVRQPVDSDEIKTERQITGNPNSQDHTSSSHKDAKQADLEIKLNEGSNNRSNGKVGCDMPRNPRLSPEPQRPAPDSTSHVMPIACGDNPTIPVSTATTTGFASQEIPEAGAKSSLRNENLDNEAIVTTPTRDAPHVVNHATEPHPIDNSANIPNSLASTASSSSHPTSIREIESNTTSGGTKTVTDSSPSVTTQTTSSQESTSPNVPSIAKTPQEITLAELKAQKAAMLASLGALPAIQVLMEENATSDADCGSDDEPTDSDIMKAANKIVKDHIKLLHEYNELKDVGQGLMGLIADQRGVRIVEVQEEFGIEAND